MHGQMVVQSSLNELIYKLVGFFTNTNLEVYFDKLIPGVCLGEPTCDVSKDFDHFTWVAKNILILRIWLSHD